MTRWSILLVVLIPGLTHFTVSQQGHTIVEARDRVIALDAGHSPQQPGARSARGEGEYFFNVRFARLLCDSLHARGYRRAYLIETGHGDASPERRAVAAVEKHSDILLSLHHDSVQKIYLQRPDGGELRSPYCNRFSGYSIFVSTLSKSYDRSALLAKCIGEHMRARGFEPSLHHAEDIPGERKPLLDSIKGVYDFKNLRILKKATMPAVLIECGILVNSEEERKLKNPDYAGQDGRGNNRRSRAVFCVLLLSGPSGPV